MWVRRGDARAGQKVGGGTVHMRHDGRGDGDGDATVRVMGMRHGHEGEGEGEGDGNTMERAMAA